MAGEEHGTLLLLLGGALVCFVFVAFLYHRDRKSGRAWNQRPPDDAPHLVWYTRHCLWNDRYMIAGVLFAAFLISTLTHFLLSYFPGVPIWVHQLPMALLIPALPMAYWLWGTIRAFRRLDELQRLIVTEGVIIGFAASVFVMFVYGILEVEGFPRLSGTWVAMMMIGFMMIGRIIAARHYGWMGNLDEKQP